MILQTETTAPCPPGCPGCAARHLDPVLSTDRKGDWLRKTLSAWQDAIGPVETVEDHRRTGYREDVTLLTRFSNTEGWQLCLVKKDNYYPVCRCPVHAERVRTSWAVLSSLLPFPDQGFPLAYYLQTGGQAVLVLKARTCPVTVKEKLMEAIRRHNERLPLDGIWIHCFPSAGKRLTAKPGWELIWGSPFSEDSGGLRYGPRTFRQAIPDLHDKALKRVSAHLEPGPHQPIIDLYCGRGVSLRKWRTRGAEAIGVEQNDEAVSYAGHNAPGTTVYKGACTHRLPQLNTHLSENRLAPYRIYVNPPRTGLEPSVCEWIGNRLQPDRLAYLSCSAGTLNRDLKQLADFGLTVTSIHPYDFFPRTYHVETLVLLER